MRVTRPDPSRRDDFDHAWAMYFSIDHDPSALFCERNTFRYVPIRAVGIRIAHEPALDAALLATQAARTCGVPVLLSVAEGIVADWPQDGVRIVTESGDAFVTRVQAGEVERVRITGAPASPELLRAAHAAHVWVEDAPVLPIGRLELRHYLREQAISETLHRYGNVTIV